MRLCFGSYLAVLVSCKAVNVDNKQLCEALLHSVAPNYEFTFAGQENPDRVREDVTSKLLRCEQNLPKDVTDPARTADPQEVALYFRDHVLGLLNENLSKQIILAFKDIIANDKHEMIKNKMHGIEDDTKIELVNGIIKRELAVQTEFLFHSFLAGIFLYTATKTTNRYGKKTIKSIDYDYIVSFNSRIDGINLIADKAASFSLTNIKNGKADTEFAEDVAGYVVDKIKLLKPATVQEDSLLVTLLSEANGNCLKCGKKLGIPKRGKIPVGNYEIVYLKQPSNERDQYENAVALCSDDCAPIVSEMSADEITDLLESKKRCAATQAFLDKISGIKFQNQIESVLREVHKIKNTKGLEGTDMKDLVEIERKIHEPYLKDKINASMARLYKTVNGICGRLEQEIGFDTNMFGGLMKSASLMLDGGVKNNGYIADPQEYIMNLLIDNLFLQVGQKHKDACEIIIGYLVKRCDLFNENAKQS